MNRIKLFFVFAFIITTIQAGAHSVWIEKEKGSDKLVARFGEFDENHEESPGYLDELDSFKIYKLGEEAKKITNNLKKDGYYINSANSNTVIIQTGFPVMARGSGPAVRPYFYARWIPNLAKKTKPAMTLDIVPTGKKGEMKVFFRNKPLTNVPVTLFTPEANDEDLKTNSEGIFKFSNNEKGLFMLKVGRYREEREGFERGKHFSKESHNCSVTWVQ